uniref:Putative ml domain-containing protein n=1 Tax=Ixodes scapularis TaxID=6945 RepID=A0A4D5RSF6_IXOSC
MASSMVLPALCVFAIVLAASAEDALSVIKVDPCKEGSTNNVKEVRMTHCGSLPCIVKLADKPRFEVDAVAERNSNVMRLKVQGQIGSLKPENFPGFKSDACSQMGVECPLVAGKQYTAKSQLTMSPSFPPVRVSTHFFISTFFLVYAKFASSFALGTSPRAP